MAQGFCSICSAKARSGKVILVRFGLDGALEPSVFGYFDKNDEFVEQGALPAPEISQGADLAVLVHDNVYDVIVNGQPQQQNIPLRYNGGHVALTTWFSMRFDDVLITAAEQPFVATSMPPARTGARPWCRLLRRRSLYQ